LLSSANGPLTFVVSS